MAEPAEVTQPKRARWPWLLAAGLVAGLVGLYFAWPAFGAGVHEGWTVFRTGDHDRISAWVQQFGWWGPVLIVGAMVLQMFLVVVNIVLLVLVAVLAYGPIWGSALALLGVVVASSVGFGLGRLVGHDAVVRWLGPQTTQKFDRVLHRYGFWAVVLARLSPLLSDDAISVVAGVAGMRYRRFLLATVLGAAPLIGLLAWLGQDWERLRTGLIWVSVLGALGLVGWAWWERRAGDKPA